MKQLYRISVPFKPTSPLNRLLGDAQTVEIEAGDLDSSLGRIIAGKLLLITMFHILLSP